MHLIGVDATANTTKAEVDLFGPNLMDDFMGAPSVATTDSATEKPDEVDLFADADFVSVPPLPEPKSSSKTEVSFKLINLIYSTLLSSLHLTINKQYLISEGQKEFLSFGWEVGIIVLVNSSFCCIIHIYY